MSRVKHHDDSRATEDTATILEMKTNALAGQETELGCGSRKPVSNVGSWSIRLQFNYSLEGPTLVRKLERTVSVWFVVFPRIPGEMWPRYSNKDAAICDDAITIPKPRSALTSVLRRHYCGTSRLKGASSSDSWPRGVDLSISWPRSVLEHSTPSLFRIGTLEKHAVLNTVSMPSVQ
jgi:hypothetical protein